MSIAGMGYGAAEALASEQERKLREFQVKEQARLAQEALAQRQLEEQNQHGARLRTLDLADLRRRDDNNARGMDLMRSDKQQMDTDTAMAGLPPHLKPLEGLVRIGAMGKMSPEDMQSPEDRANAQKADEERQIRIRRASITPTQAPERKPMVVKMQDGTIRDLNNVLPDGAVPYDPVAARSSKPEDQVEALDTAKEVQRLATALRQHKGLNGAFGSWGARMPTVSQNTADAETLLNSLASMLTMENMGKMKGVLSDSDMKVLRQASTTLNPSMSESAARAELERIATVMSNLTGEPVSFGKPAAPPAPAAGRGTAAASPADALIEKYRKKPS